MKLLHLAGALLCGLLLTQCVSTPSASDEAIGPLASVTQAESLAIAERYLNHRWAATEKQAMHGVDPDGVRVDTPDATFRPAGRTPGWWKSGQVNVGIPYCWGADDTPESFDQGVRQGKWAGDIYTSAKRKGLASARSKHTVGADCSGFISRCWNLDWHCSTRTIPKICDKLATYDELQPGDALNTVNGHVLLFAAFSKPDKSELLVYETGSPLGWLVTKHTTPVGFLQGLGYEPYRYRGMRR
ncbi:hypothetical protein DES53_1075 [Roseimicrobium gellanilyticum]|uniref:NlpC/P60 family protein n=1 Tax=Roseimicrobium gellanilyticum TaxID=748857 RepID=A0A366HGW5_9BACT|nr:hypothetical protein [Roseimicrobium gellanilyticum]RBP41176.1 hypothetical protein DES53_1075 [Roseimicrobium gellanilyticum]